jgi:hypothetical protein
MYEQSFKSDQLSYLTQEAQEKINFGTRDKKFRRKNLRYEPAWLPCAANPWLIRSLIAGLILLVLSL